MTTWTADMDDLLKKLRSEGVSSARIARQIGTTLHVPVSRCAVVGRAFRLGLAKPGQSKKERRGETHIYQNGRRARGGGVARLEARVFGEHLKIMTAGGTRENRRQPLPAPTATDIARVASIIDLEPHHCKFPVGEPVTGFCGDARMEGLPYCAAHAARCYDVSRVPLRQSKAAPNANALLNVRDFVEA